MGYSNEDVDTVLNDKLCDNAKQELYKYFDGELNVKKAYLKSDYIWKIVNEIIPAKLHMLNRKDKKTIDSQLIDKVLFDGYLKEIKETKVFNEQSISNLNISDEEKYYLNVEFVFNKLSTFKSKDIATLLNMEYSEYISNVYEAILSARNILNTTIDDNLKHIKKVLDKI